MGCRGEVTRKFSQILLRKHQLDSIGQE